MITFTLHKNTSLSPFRSTTVTSSSSHPATICMLSSLSIGANDSLTGLLIWLSHLIKFTSFSQTISMSYMSSHLLVCGRLFLVSTWLSTSLIMRISKSIINGFWFDIQLSAVFMISFLIVAFLILHCGPYKMIAIFTVS